ncbi:YIP1 family protein [Deinococcus sp. YIM 77859]|uniref:YIP1 family protein n=1 Tax=Deinococcus sp. YIM 77859 TaxID=1540221 RepID=UPI000559411C|nr:YIP1 family protein [Deinococcus sp. YIM 77859]
MARRPRPAPPAAELLTAPRTFFERLRAAEPRVWRYLAPVLLSALLAGVLYALLLRPVVAALAGAAHAAPAFTAHVTNAFGSFFLTVLGAGAMAGLGALGAGREGRAAEVYGATFVLLPPVYLLLAVLLLVLPGPEATAAAPGTDLLAAQRVALRAVAQAPLTRLTVLVLLLATLAQCVLAYPGFLVLTGDRRRALLGTLLPLLPALGLTALSLAPLLTAMF